MRNSLSANLRCKKRIPHKRLSAFLHLPKLSWLPCLVRDITSAQADERCCRSDFVPDRSIAIPDRDRISIRRSRTEQISVLGEYFKAVIAPRLDDQTGCRVDLLNITVAFEVWPGEDCCPGFSRELQISALPTVAFNQIVKAVQAAENKRGAAFRRGTAIFAGTHRKPEVRLAVEILSDRFKFSI